MERMNKDQKKAFIDWYTAVAQSVRRCNRFFHDESDLGLTQLRILTYLAAYPRSPMSSIAEALILRRSTVTAAVDAMERLGLVSRIHDEDDSRIIRGFLTDAGYEALFGYVELWQRLRDEMRSWCREGSADALWSVVFPDLGEDESSEPWLNPALSLERLSLVVDEMSEQDNGNLACFLAFFEKICCVYNRIQFAAKTYGLGTNLGLILCHLGFYDGQAPLGKMRACLRLESGELTVCLDKLQKKGYIKRIIDKADRRRVFVRATKSGRLVSEKCEAESGAIFYRAFPGIADLATDDYLDLPRN